MLSNFRSMPFLPVQACRQDVEDCYSGSQIMKHYLAEGILGRLYTLSKYP